MQQMHIGPWSFGLWWGGKYSRVGRVWFRLLYGLKQHWVSALCHHTSSIQWKILSREVTWSWILRHGRSKEGRWSPRSARYYGMVTRRFVCFKRRLPCTTVYWVDMLIGKGLSGTYFTVRLQIIKHIVLDSTARFIETSLCGTTSHSRVGVTGFAIVFEKLFHRWSFQNRIEEHFLSWWSDGVMTRKDFQVGINCLYIRCRITSFLCKLCLGKATETIGSGEWMYFQELSKEFPEWVTTWYEWESHFLSWAAEIHSE